MIIIDWGLVCIMYIGCNELCIPMVRPSTNVFIGGAGDIYIYIYIYIYG